MGTRFNTTRAYRFAACMVVTLGLLPTTAQPQELSQDPGNLISSPTGNPLADKMVLIRDKIEEVYTKGLADKIEADTFKDIARYLINNNFIKVTDRSLDYAVVNLSREIADGVNSKIMKVTSGGMKLTTDMVLSAFVDFCADKVKDALLAQKDHLGESGSVIAAATAWVSIKQAYNIASNKSAAGVIASQAQLMLEVLQEDYKAIKEYADARDDQIKSELGNKALGIYAQYIRDISNAGDGASRMILIVSLQSELAALRNSYRPPYSDYVGNLASGILDNAYAYEKRQADSVMFPPYDTKDNAGGGDICTTSTCKDIPPPPKIEISTDDPQPSGTPAFTGKLLDYRSNGWWFETANADITSGDGGTSKITPGYNRIDGTTNIFANNQYMQISGRIIETNAATRGDYKYTDWGGWTNVPDGTGVNPNRDIGSNGIWVIGQNTLPVDMPKYGTAVYNGDMIGARSNGEMSTFNGTVSGTIALNVNFATSAIDGSYSLPGFRSGFIAPTTYYASGNSVKFDSGFQDAQGNGYGSINGVFNGSRAQEAAGSWWFNGPGRNDRVDGIFRAKR